MNLARYGLLRRPFRSAVESAPETLARLRAGFTDGDGVALLDGEPGIGKTCAALQFLASLPAETSRVFVPSARLSRPVELFQAILFDLGKPWQGVSEHELRLGVTEYFLGELAAGRRGVLVLDEAHLMDAEALEEVRLLDNLEARGAKAVFTLLVGLPRLRAQLGASLAQRIGGRHRLEPLGLDDAVAFLHRHIETCGGRPARLLSAEAAELIAESTAGVPRLLTQLASLAFATTVEAGQDQIDVEAVYEAMERLGLTPAASDSSDDALRPAESGGSSSTEAPAKDEPGADARTKQKPRKRRIA